jgi:hypothetical protein
MRRIHLFEFTDQSWYPPAFRRMQTDYLQFVAALGSGQQNLVPLLLKAMRQAGTTEIVDLCSGGSGPWARLLERLEEAGCPASVKLTDKYPDPEALQKWAAGRHLRIEYLPEPVDAQVPASLPGMRTLFEGFHHFNPAQARSILEDAARQRAPIGVFEISLRPPLGIFLLLLAPLSTLSAYFLLTPFIKPRRFWRYFWTYLIPLVPLATCWDGVVSLLRVYSSEELADMAGSLICQDYAWETGKASTGTPVFDYIYLVGYPV